MLGIFSTTIFKLSIFFNLRWSALNCSNTPTTADPSCHVLNLLGSVSQSWFMLSLIIKGSGTPLLKCFWDFARNINFSRDVSLCVLLDWATRVCDLTTVYTFTIEICYFFLIYWILSCVVIFLSNFIILFCSSSIELHASQIKNSGFSMLWIFLNRSLLQGWIWHWLNFRRWHHASSNKLRLNSKCWLIRWVWNEGVYNQDQR